jgi:hypothetical protein
MSIGHPILEQALLEHGSNREMAFLPRHMCPQINNKDHDLRSRALLLELLRGFVSDQNRILDENNRKLYPNTHILP